MTCLGVPKKELHNEEQAVKWWIFSTNRASWNSLADAFYRAGYGDVAESVLIVNMGMFCNCYTCHT